MRILFLSHRVPYPPNKGEKIRTYHQIKYLHEQGHSLGVLSPIAESDDQQYLNKLSQLHLHLPSSLHALSPLSLPFGLLKHQALSVANFYCSSLQKTFDEALIQQNIDTVICSSSAMAEYVFKSAICQGKTQHKAPKVIMDFMDLDSDKWRQYAEQKSGPMRYVYKREHTLLSRYENKVYEHFDASFFISNEEVKLFLNGRQNNGKLTAIGNGIDTEFFKPTQVREQINDPVLVFTGVMDYLPNVDAVEWFVKDIWPHIIAEHPNATFYIAGMNPNDKVKRLTLTQGVIVTGKVEDIREYYAKADIFVAPLRLARGVQNKILQAFACGLPVVSTPTGNEGIGAKDGEEILIGDDVTKFIEHLHGLLNDPNQMRKLAINAEFLVVREFSWKSCLKKIDCLLKN